VLAADRLTAWLRTQARVACVLERGLGVAVIALGVLLALAVL
jgi:threonine/homoserine/homoserine lactone efflux protein